MPLRFLIYGLIDPRSGELRYVGKSTSGFRRPRQHFERCRLSNDRSYKANWLRSLGSAPEIEVLEAHTSAEPLYEAEQFWIAYYKAIGCGLTNHTDGGPGQSGRHFSADHRRKLGGRAVQCSDGRRYLSVNDAARRLNLFPASVSRAAKTGGQTGGYTFCYVE